MRVLAVTHGPSVGPGIFAEVVAARGDALEEWCVPNGAAAPAVGRYDAVMVFGGGMHADQEDRHLWLRGELDWLRGALEAEVPLLGVCLGAQLVARAAGARVHPAGEVEIGWLPVQATPAAGDDPVFAGLPRRFDAFQWHEYTYDLPGGARELAASPVCNQAYRLGDRVWGVQFHPEVTAEIVEAWLREEEPPGRVSADELLAETQARIAGWNDFGRALCARFLDAG